MRAYLLLTTLLLALPAGAQQTEQTPTAAVPRAANASRCSVVRYGVGGAGSRCVVGIRASLRDRGHRRVTGVDLSVLGENPLDGADDSSSVVTGVTLGLVGADAAELNGLNAGLLYVVGTHALRGVSFGGVAVGSDGVVQGVTVGGIFVAGKEMTGINVGGIAVVGDRVRGLNVAGFGTFAKEISGVSLGFGVAGGRVRGLSAAGWLVHGGPGGLAGVSASFVGVGAEGPVRGISAAGLGVFGKRDVTGIAAALGMVDARELNGVAASAHNRVRGTQRGLTLGLVNRAQRLRGVQIGLLNEARNNPRLLRWLPGVNVHL
ncbi:MAG TPA: hypothetical protein VKA84_15625 [Gemmatimonadaceae bacterium]|nr:hypothetical protein [Gemmatimonadaceae bacterium]